MQMHMMQRYQWKYQLLEYVVILKLWVTDQIASLQSLGLKKSTLSSRGYQKRSRLLQTAPTTISENGTKPDVRHD